MRVEQLSELRDERLRLCLQQLTRKKIDLLVYLMICSVSVPESRVRVLSGRSTHLEDSSTV